MEDELFNRLAEDIANKYNEFDIILIQGIPGSGKTTLAKKLSERFGIDYHEADQYFYEVLGGFDKDKLGQAHSWCKRLVDKDIRSDRKTIVSNTSLTDWEVKNYASLGKLYIIRMETEYQNIHNVPEETVKAMKRKRCTFTPDFIVA